MADIKHKYSAQTKLPNPIWGGWEWGLIAMLILLYVAGVFINPGFFGTTDAAHAVFRDASRFGVMAIGMTFVIVNKDLDLSVGSIVGLTSVVFSMVFSPTHYDMGIWAAIGIASAAGLSVGLINGILVTYLRVPAFIATLTMLFIGRGLVLALTGGKTIGYNIKAKEYAFFGIGETGFMGINSQIPIFIILAIIGAIVLGYTRWGMESYATGGNALATEYSGVSNNWVRIRAYLLSSGFATLAGLMHMAQDKTVTSQYGQGNELIVIAAVIVGGASILGGRGRVLGACLGALLIVLIDKVLREGIPTTRTITIGETEMTINGMAQLPPGAVPAFLGMILIAAVLFEPLVLKKKVPQRIWAWLRKLPAPVVSDTGGVAIEGAQTKGTATETRNFHPTGIKAFLVRRDAAAIMLVIVLWSVGMYLRPDFWGNISNSFNLLLAFTEVAILCVGLTFVIANGDIDLSVGAILALSGATAAFLMKNMGVDPIIAVALAFLAGTMAGVVNGVLITRFALPAFVATLGMFYIARGLGAWMVAGRQLSGFPEGFNLLGRKLIELLRYLNIAPESGLFFEIATALSFQTIIMVVIAIGAGIVLGYTPIGQAIYATGGNRRAADYSGINTNRVRFRTMVFSAMCASVAGVIYIAFFRSFNPSAGQLRELDAIAAVIIGGGSIFGGYGTIIGALAGAAVITLIRSLLSLQIITDAGESFVMPQHWVNVFIGLILIIAVLADIWIRQNDLIGQLRKKMRKRNSAAESTHE